MRYPVDEEAAISLEADEIVSEDVDGFIDNVDGCEVGSNI